MSTVRTILAHPSGNQFFRHLAQTLRDAEMLAEVCTAIDWNPRGLAARGLPGGVRRELARRSFSIELGVPVSTHPAREVARLLAARLGLQNLTRHERGWCSVDAVYRDFDTWVARRLQRTRTTKNATAVYAYEDAAEATFRRAGELGLRRVYDLPIAYWETSRRLLDEEAARLPEWEPTLVGTRDSAEKLERKTCELALADLVVCPSRFVTTSLPADIQRTKRVVLAPFGSPPVATSAPLAAAPTRSRRDGPLRVLFAGSMTQRKGLADLFAAMRLLPRGAAELFVLGSPVVAPAFYRGVFADFSHESPRPHAEVLAFMRTCDVLCLPSIVEGRALVVQEAMSVGLPVIVTANTGADDVVEDAVNGFLVPIRSPEAIAAKLTWLAENRAALPEFSARAIAAASRATWARYGAIVVEALRAA